MLTAATTEATQGHVTQKKPLIGFRLLTLCKRTYMKRLRQLHIIVIDRTGMEGPITRRPANYHIRALF